MDAALPQPRPLLFPVLGTVLVICWASGFVGIRFATETEPVAGVLFWRSALSGVLLLPLALSRGARITGRIVLEQGLFAFLGMFLYLGGFAWAIAARVPTGLVALMADMVPLAIALLSRPMLGERLHPRQWLGTAIGLAGVLAASADALQLGDAPAAAYALPLLGMVAFALSTVLQKRMPARGLAIPQRLALQCLWAAAMFAPFAISTGGLVPVLSPQFVLGVGWLVLLATFGAWTIYYLCLRLYAPTRVSAMIYLSPPVTMLWAHLMFGEPVTAAMLAGLAVTLFGVSLVTGGKD